MAPARPAAFAAVTASFVLPSLAVIARFGGLGAVLTHVIVVVGFFWVAPRHLGPDHGWGPSPRALTWWTGLTLAGILVFAALAYPLANSGRFGGGSDADDATVIAVHELLAGRYPYYPKTYLGNPITPMPGALILAAPFVALGQIALLNPAWLIGLFACIARRLRDRRAALLLLWALLVLCPTVLHQLATGVDYFANTLYVLLAIWWLERATRRAAGSGVFLAAAVVLLGVALSSRANFALLLPVVVGHIAGRVGWRRALFIGAAVGCAALFVTLPFYAQDPAAFSPLHTVNKLARFDTVLPHAALLVPGASLVLACALAYSPGTGLAALLWRCAAVQAFLVACGIVLASVAAGRLDLLSFSHFADFAAFFAIVAYWLDWFEDDAQPQTPRPDFSSRIA